MRDTYVEHFYNRSGPHCVENLSPTGGISKEYTRSPVARVSPLSTLLHFSLTLGILYPRVIRISTRLLQRFFVFCIYSALTLFTLESPRSTHWLQNGCLYPTWSNVEPLGTTRLWLEIHWRGNRKKIMPHPSDRFCARPIFSERIQEGLRNIRVSFSSHFSSRLLPPVSYFIFVSPRRNQCVSAVTGC